MSQHHTCDWPPPPPAISFACPECDATPPACVNADTRRGPHPTGTSNLACDPCLQLETWVLDHITAALEWWDPRDAYREKPPMAFDLVRTTGTSHNRLRTPNDINAELTAWAIRWSTHTGGTN